MAELSKHAEGLSDKKKELLELLLREKREKKEEARKQAESRGPDGVSTGAKIPRRETFSPAPVAFAQQRLWFIDQLDPGTPAFNIPAAIRVRGELDLSILERAFAAVVERHETLRTRFGSEGGRPVQIIESEAEIEIPVLDLRDLPEDERMARVQEMVTEECQRSFDLTVCPLVRVTLLELDDDDHVMVVMMHHIIGDVWSVRVLMRELATLCSAFARGEEPDLPELPIQYADYAVWHRDWLQGDNLEKEQAYWQEQLAAMPEELRLPTDHPRPAVQSVWGAKQFLRLAKGLADDLRALGRDEGASLFMVLLAAWKALLSRYTGQTDIVVGAPVANRNRSEFEPMIGFYVNSLVLRTDLSGDPTFRELVRRQRDVVLGAFSHQDFPFERLVEMLQPERNMSRNPIFQTDFILQNAPRSAYEVPGLSFEPLPVENGTAQLDMTLDLWEEDDGIGGWLEYDVDLFDATTIARVVGHYERLLEQAVAAPDRPLPELRPWPAPQLHQLGREWNDTARRYELETPFPELWARWADERPDAVAVTSGDVTISYAALHARARALGAWLHRETGLGTDQVAGVLGPRSAELLTAMLGVFETGAAYLPMDPNHPAPRHAQVLEQSRAPVVLAARELLGVVEEALGDLPPDRRPRVLALEDTLAEAVRAPGSAAGEAVPAPATADSLAYAIYTSGSTGTPKGVMIHHRGMLNHLWANVEYLDMDDRDVLAQTANQCFDISVWQFFAPLLLGGRAEIVPESVTLDPIRLIHEVDRRGVTVFETVPSLLRIMLSGQGADAPPPLAALRWLLPTGEALPPELSRSWFETYPHIPLVNAYGPSECSDDVTLETLTEPVPEERPNASIGRPVANLTVHVLDRERRQVPQGVPGELYVGGVGVGRGYMNEPVRTAQAFVANPLAQTPGDRLYKSGDLGRLLSDGRLEFLGRVDFQVKIRGFRIELGEVEAMLDRHRSVAEAVAMARKDSRGETVLVGYLVPAGEAPSQAELREHMRGKLPEYMVPQAFVYLDDMPRSANGKIDRKRLPAPEAEPASETPYVAPRNPNEEVLAGMWEDILAVERVGVETNLFELGAHSLLVTQVVSRIRDAFEVEPPLRSFFEDPTVAGMARTIERLQEEAEGRDIPPIAPVSRDESLPLSYTQERMWFLDQLEPGLTAYNVPGAVHMDGELGFLSLAESFGEILRRHEVFRTTYTSVRGKPVQVLHEPEPLALPVVDLTGLDAGVREDVALALARDNAQRPFDLEHGPVLRPILARLDDQRHLLAMTTHHIAYDMWAREIFIFELGSLYQSYVQGGPSPLPEPRIQYVDFAYWQRQWLQGDVLEAELEFWREALEGIPSHLELSTDFPRPPVQSYRGRRQYLKLSKDLARSIHALSKREGVTPYIAVLAAFQALLARYTGQTGIPVGSPIANRNRSEVENLIGFLANTLVLYTDLSGNPTYRELLQRTRETALDAYAHQDIPFEFLVQELLPERDMSRAPLFQVMFNYMLSYSAPSVDLPDLTLRLERLHSGAAQFDINVDMWETGDGLYGVVEYVTDIFHDTTITRFVGHLETILEGAVGDPERTLDALPILTREENHQLLRESTDTARAYDLEPSWAELVAARVEETPDAVAAVCDTSWMSYRELWSRAGAVASVLREHGVGTDDVVGLLDVRGLPLVVSMAGVLRAGAAYLPMDPDHPPERHRQVLRQSRATHVLVSRALRSVLDEALRELPEEDHPWLGLLEDLPPRAEAEPPLPPRAADALSYVIYTSGSTGVPKGVMIHQRGMLNHIRANVEFLSMDGGDVLAQTANQCFDISVWQFLAPLVLGSRVHVFEDRVTENPPRLLEAVEREQVTVFETVPSLLALMLEETGGELDLAALRWLLPTGEALPPELSRRWLRAYPEIPLVNAYGPSECSDDVTLHSLRDVPRADGRPAAIGRAVGNLTVTLLDRWQRPVPLGNVGEIAVGGVGVGRGYLHEPARTAPVFVPDPFFREPGARLYRSGDLGRRLPDGTLEFHGRIDHQVKVRGFRIELGEIESVLGEQDTVRETVVVVREDRPNDRRLVGYVVPAEGAEPEPDALKKALRERLPDYMVPTFLLVLEELPLSPNGKVDREALPAPEGRPVEETYVAPRDELEERLAEIFQEILGLEKVGIHDDFFDLGGHSLLAIQVLSRIRDAFGVEPPLRVLFETSTIQGMAEAVRAVQWAMRSMSDVEAEAMEDFEEGVLEEEGVI